MVQCLTASLYMDKHDMKIMWNPEQHFCSCHIFCIFVFL